MLFVVGKRSPGEGATLLVNLASYLKAKIDQGSVSFMDIYESVLARIADFDRLKAKGARVRAGCNRLRKEKCPLGISADFGRSGARSS